MNQANQPWDSKMQAKVDEINALAEKVHVKTNDAISL